MNDAIFLQLPPGCISATFIRRVKRFSVELEKDGERIWAHTNNTGAMLGLPGSGCMALLSPANNPGRKLPYTLERLQRNAGHGDKFWIGVNTSVPNRLLETAFKKGGLAFAEGYDSFRREAPLGQSRLDACLTGAGKRRLWVECKNVTLVEDGVALFPDAASERARKHLRDLMEIVRRGERAAMFYAVQRPDAACFGPADFIDPHYGRLFYEAIEAGVEVYAHELRQLPQAVALGPALRLKGKF